MLGSAADLLVAYLTSAPPVALRTVSACEVCMYVCRVCRRDPVPAQERLGVAGTGGGVLAPG